MLLKDIFKEHEYPQFLIHKCIYTFSDYKLTESKKSVLYKCLEFRSPPNNVKYADFMLPLELFFRDIKNTNLSVPQTKAVKSKILDTPFCSFDSFNNNKMRGICIKKNSKFYIIYVNKII